MTLGLRRQPLRTQGCGSRGWWPGRVSLLVPHAFLIKGSFSCWAAGLTNASLGMDIEGILAGAWSKAVEGDPLWLDHRVMAARCCLWVLCV